MVGKKKNRRILLLSQNLKKGQAKKSGEGVVYKSKEEAPAWANGAFVYTTIEQEGDLFSVKLNLDDEIKYGTSWYSASPDCRRFTTKKEAMAFLDKVGCDLEKRNREEAST